MRTRRPSPEHQQAVARRLAQLSAELAATRPSGGLVDPPDVAEAPDDPDDWWEDHTRVAVLPAPVRALDEARPERSVPTVLPPPPPVPPPSRREEPPVVPRPGRHAARRRGAGSGSLPSGLGDLVPEALRGRFALGPGQVAVVAVLVALGLAVTSWWVVRGQPTEEDARPPVAPTGGLVTAGEGTAAVAQDGSAAPLVPAPGSAAGASPTTVTVDVAGKVRRPGIVVLDAGSRVVDALEAAGGARRGTDLSALNLARLLVDGEQVLVGAPMPGAPPALGSAAVTPPPATGVLVNLNTATLTELETLPEVGPVTAQSIITWRDQHGGFTAVEELLEVDGIGEATLAQLAPHVTV